MHAKYQYPSTYFRKAWKSKVDAWRELHPRGHWNKFYGYLLYKLELAGADDSFYFALHRFILTTWSASSSYNISNALLLGRMHGKTSEEVIESINRHRFFREPASAKKWNQQIDELYHLGMGALADIRTHERTMIYAMKNKLKHEGLTQEREEQLGNELLLEDIERQGNNSASFSTTGWKKLEESFHPIQSPKYKDAMCDDYHEMQIQLGIPSDNISVQKMFKDVGVPKMFHTYGILASQWFQKQDETWTVYASKTHKHDNRPPYWYGMGQYHYATQKTEPISVVDDEEFFIVASAFKKLDSISPDSTKLFSLMVHLYEHYSNENEGWKEEWDNYIGAEVQNVPDHERPQEFARFFFEQFKDERLMLGKTTWRQLAELYLCEDIDEWDCRHDEFADEHKDFSTWDTFIRDKYFKYDNKAS